MGFAERQGREVELRQVGDEIGGRTSQRAADVAGTFRRAVDLDGTDRQRPRRAPGGGDLEAPTGADLAGRRDRARPARDRDLFQIDHGAVDRALGLERGCGAEQVIDLFDAERKADALGVDAEHPGRAARLLGAPRSRDAAVRALLGSGQIGDGGLTGEGQVVQQPDPPLARHLEIGAFERDLAQDRAPVAEHGRIDRDGRRGPEQPGGQAAADPTFPMQRRAHADLLADPFDAQRARNPGVGQAIEHRLPQLGRAVEHPVIGGRAQPAVEAQRARGAGLDQQGRGVDAQGELDPSRPGRPMGWIDDARRGHRRLVATGREIEGVERLRDGAATRLEAHFWADQGLIGREQGRGGERNPAMGLAASLGPTPRGVGRARFAR